MIIDKRIFNELVEIDLGPTDNWNLLERYAIARWNKMTPEEQQIYREDNDLDDKDSDTVHDAFRDDIVMNIVNLYKVPKDSLLERAIFTYGRAKFGTNLFDTFDQLGLVLVDDEAYFDAGYGYDIVDGDLLGGSGNGDAKREFLKIINEND